MRYLNCFTMRKWQWETKKLSHVCQSGKWWNPPNPHSQRYLITCDLCAPMLSQCPHLLCAFLDSALSLDSRIPARVQFLANWTLPRPSCLCPLCSLHWSHWRWAREKPRLCWDCSYSPGCHFPWQSRQVLVHHFFIYSRQLWSQVSSFLKFPTFSPSPYFPEDSASHFTEEAVTVWRWIYPFLDQVYQSICIFNL